MSDTSVVAPPPPPPPPPQKPSFDFVQPFTFLFQDERWVQKVLIGGLFYMAGFVLIGFVFLAGYCMKLTRNVIAGVPKPLPEWDDLGTYFSDGLKLVGAVLGYTIPVVALILIVMIPAGLLTAFTDRHNDFGGDVAGSLMGCAWCLALPVYFLLLFWMPAVMLFVAIENRVGAAFEFKRIFDFIKNNFLNYLLAFVVYLVAKNAAGFGVLLLCVGIVFTAFWAMVTGAYAFAQTYRLSLSKN